jgi:hypothetical protein
MTLRQKEPRVRDEKHLNYVRSLPCCICGRRDVDAAHIRTASLEHGKRGLGMQEKASDCWIVPLCRFHHSEQHSMSEMGFWKRYDLDPFMLAITLKEQS